MVGWLRSSALEAGVNVVFGFVALFCGRFCGRGEAEFGDSDKGE